MSIPLQVTFRDFPHSPALEDTVRAKVKKLEETCDKISHCRVVIGLPHRRHHKGHLYHVNIEMGVPGRDIVVKRCPDRHSANQDAYIAIRDAFGAITRQLKAYASKRRPG
jgi:ribosome-associated translation inhibitor RaiA